MTLRDFGWFIVDVVGGVVLGLGVLGVVFVLPCLLIEWADQLLGAL